ncbi:MAG: hypothetical protein R3F14_44665 [Polyangiaceae bacterium]
MDIDGNSGGSKHGGTVTFPGPVSIHSQEMSEGNGQFSGQVHGNKYSWQTNCSSFQGVHEVITLKWDGFGAR